LNERSEFSSALLHCRLLFSLAYAPQKKSWNFASASQKSKEIQIYLLITEYHDKRINKAKLTQGKAREKKPIENPEVEMGKRDQMDLS
jgi:hypothetical protein